MTTENRYQYSEDRLIKFDTYSDSWPARPEDCAYLVEDNSKLDLDSDSSEDGSISYYQGEKGALVIEHDSDGTENAYKSGFYLTSSFQEYKEMYLVSISCYPSDNRIFFSITIPRKNKYQILKFFFDFPLVDKIKAVYLQCRSYTT